MTFYQQCFGGELTFQGLREAPLTAKLPEKMKDPVVHASLMREGLVLMGSDMVDEKGLIRGNSVSLLLNCSNEKELKEYYQKLSEGGKGGHPPDRNDTGALFGDLTDKFGNNWLLHCPLYPDT